MHIYNIPYIIFITNSSIYFTSHHCIIHTVPKSMILHILNCIENHLCVNDKLSKWKFSNKIFKIERGELSLCERYYICTQWLLHRKRVSKEFTYTIYTYHPLLHNVYTRIPMLLSWVGCIYSVCVWIKRMISNTCVHIWKETFLAFACLPSEHEQNRMNNANSIDFTEVRIIRLVSYIWYFYIYICKNNNNNNNSIANKQHQSIITMQILYVYVFWMNLNAAMSV